MLFKMNTFGDIAIFRVNSSHLSGEIALALKDEVRMVTALAERHILIDMTLVKQIDYASLATLIGLMKTSRRQDGFSLCCLTKSVWKRLKRTRLDKIFTVFPTRSDALQPNALGPYTLTDKKALVLCAGTGSRARPLSFAVPKPMFDVMGKPLLHHCIDHLKSWGIRNIALNPSHLPETIENYFGSGGSLGIQTTISREGTQTQKGFVGHAVGSAASIRLIQQRFQFFDDDFFVFCGDAIVDLDLNEMMRCHKRTGAIATIASLTVDRADVHKYGVIKSDAQGQITAFQEKPCPQDAVSRQVNCGIYIFSPSVLDHIPLSGQFDIGADLLPALIERNQHVQAFESQFDWTDIGCIRDYYLANAKAVKGSIKNLTTSAREIRPNVWAENSASVSPHARIHGPTYVGRDTVIEAGASLSGTNIIGTNCLVSDKTYCRDSIVLPDTVLLPGAVVSGMCVEQSWSIRHSFALGEVTEFQCLDYVCGSATHLDREKGERARRA